MTTSKVIMKCLDIVSKILYCNTKILEDDHLTPMFLSLVACQWQVRGTHYQVITLITFQLITSPLLFLSSSTIPIHTLYGTSQAICHSPGRWHAIDPPNQHPSPPLETSPNLLKLLS